MRTLLALLALAAPANPGTECPANAALLLRIPGVGADKLSGWTAEARRTAIANGWLVHEQRVEASVRETIAAAHAECPERKMLIAAYSDGAYLMRYAVRNLAPEVRAAIVRVDLVSDPTADRSIDTLAMQYVRALGGRRTDGIDTWSKRGVYGRDSYYRQPAYPPDLAPRTFQYCAQYDYVCDFTLANFRRASRAAHERYAWRRIGASAAHALAK